MDGEPQVDLVLAEIDDVRDALEWALEADIVLAAEADPRPEASSYGRRTWENPLTSAWVRLQSCWRRSL